MNSTNPPLFYEGSVKDLKGPVRLSGAAKSNEEALIFDYTDAFSVFDWGRMPEQIPHKGAALSTLAAGLFEVVEDPGMWKEFSASPTAQSLRKSIDSVSEPVTHSFYSSRSLSGLFNEIAEEFQSQGLRTHYLGSLDGDTLQPKKVFDCASPPKRFAVRKLHVVRPTRKQVLGRDVFDYQPTHRAERPTLIPLEVIFRFGCPGGSSLLKRIAKRPDYFSALPLPKWGGPEKIEAGAQWSFPLVEFSTKLEPTDRMLSLSEAILMSHLSGEEFVELFLKSVWTAGFLKDFCQRRGLELWDGKLEWGLDSDGRSFLVDAIGPDELRILKGKSQLSKEFLRAFYEKTNWFQKVKEAKMRANTEGVSDWQKFVEEDPPKMDSTTREIALQIYPSVANHLLGRELFAGAWSVERVVNEIQKTAAP